MIWKRATCTAVVIAVAWVGGVSIAAEGEFAASAQPFLTKYCVDCHRGPEAEAEVRLDPESRGDQLLSADAKLLVRVSDVLRTGDMPPREADQPMADERRAVEAFLDRFLSAAAAAQAGDPGPSTPRRLNNVEYTHTIRDLTGVPSLDPAREFPVDGAAGEGFTNAANALTISSGMIDKYLAAGKHVAAHAMLLPDGIRFSPYDTRRDWSKAKIEEIKAFYSRYTSAGSGSQVVIQGLVFDDVNSGGRLPVESYLTALVANRDALVQHRTTPAQVASERELNAKYLTTLWTALGPTSETRPPSTLLDAVRGKLLTMSEADVPQLAGDIAAWQKALFRFNVVGHIGSKNAPPRWMEAVSVLDVVPETLKASPWATAVATPAGAREPAPAPLTTLLSQDTPEAKEQIELACNDFRQLFPPVLCYAAIVPVDTVVTLRLFHREDDHLCRLMLDDAETQQLDTLWDELFYLSQHDLVVTDALEQIIQFATQDYDPTLFEPLREPFAAKAALYRQRLIDDEPKQLASTISFAERAARRPLADSERESLRALYRQLRQEELPHDDAIRLVIARVLFSPAFLYRMERAPEGTAPANVAPYEIANRLSYFLTSSMPDAPLMEAAATNRILDDAGLLAETHRLLQDERAKRFAAEFACQWLHVYEFDQHNEKSETAFPTFVALRGVMHEETIRFFVDLFANDRSLLSVLDGDYTFVNAALAEHYQIPADKLVGMQPGEWRRVDGLRELGRGGILAQASTLAKQSGASRTSPILRGNWISEVLLGERLPRPPKDVPPLADDVDTSKLTVRQLVEAHSRDARCSVCHERIDPFGFALEAYDAIGRRRERDTNDQPLNLASNIRNRVTGEVTALDGLDGVRKYLGETRRDPFVRQFCRKLAGYALGRELSLADRPLVEAMQRNLQDNQYRVLAAVDTLVLSPQFRQIRGRDFVEP